MFSRRKFISKTFLTSIATGLGLIACETTSSDQGEAEVKAPKQNSHSKSSLPVVAATWDNLPATAAAMTVLKQGQSALDAVEEGVKVVEADPKNTTVGIGGFPDRDGFVTLDACIMDAEGNAGSVSFLQNILHPISVARKVMEDTPHVMLTGAGALQFAKEQGFEETDLLTAESKLAWQKWLKEKKYKPVVNVERHDTIGMLALSADGKMSGACTTSGMAFKLHGRVGDSPIIGAGLYVDNEVGGACATGVGELVLKTLGSFLIVELMRQGYSPQEACEEGIRRIVERYPTYMNEAFQIGYLALNMKGEHGAYSILEGFEYSIYQDEKNETIQSDSKVKK